MYDPLVQEVLCVWWSVEEGNLPAVVGTDPPGVLVEAIGAFGRALRATLAEDRKIREQEIEQKRQQFESSRASRAGDF